MSTEKPDLANSDLIKNVVNQWLEERRALLAEYGNLANIKTFKAINLIFYEVIRIFKIFI